MSDDLRFTRRVFFALFGASAFAAFASLALQIRGLVGSRGISPAVELLDLATRQLGTDAMWRLPSLFWLAPSDSTLDALCIGGALAAAALSFGVWPRLCIALIFVCGLSIASVGDVFLGYQWDALLLEACLPAMLFAPPGLWPRWREEPPVNPFATLTLRLLLFRLFVGSGVVKVLSGDPTWADWTALAHHFETQPLPSPMSWSAHQLPGGALALGVGFTYAVELLVPFAFFGPRTARQASFALVFLLQLGIALTGNYGYFNLLTLALAVSLLDDGAFPESWRNGAGDWVYPQGWRKGLRAACSVAALVVAAVGLSRFATHFDGHFEFGRKMPAAVRELHRELAPFRVANRYGLFAVMTTRRPEIRIEGSGGGSVWKSYELPWKPSAPKRMPSWVAPHQPRLDWQLWFAALGPAEQSPWLRRLLQRLREGSPEVVALFANDPFPDEPPLRVRATIADYRFTTPEERERSGAIWSVGLRRPFLRLDR